MKKFISLLGMLVIVLMLAACSKDVSGDYAALDKEIGQVDLNIKEKTVTMEFKTMVKAAEKSSKGFFAPKIDTSKFKLNGTIDQDKKRLNLKTATGEREYIDWID